MVAMINHDGKNDFIVTPDGQKRILNRLPPRATNNHRKFADMATPVIDRSQWTPSDLADYLTSIKDQNGRGACVGHGATEGLEISLNFQGQDKQELSAWMTYSGVDGGRDQGAVVADSLDFLRDHGTCLDSSVPYGTYRWNQISQAAIAEASRFKIRDAYALDSFDEMVTALILNCPVVFGICIGNHFQTNSSGILANYDGSAAGGHCMCAVGVVQINGIWYLKVANSWGLSWGLKGYCFMNENYINRQPYAMDAYAIRGAYLDPNGKAPAHVVSA